LGTPAEASLPTAQPPISPRDRSTRTSPVRLFADRAARWVVTAGGIAIIASILAILVFIVLEVWPLMSSARVAARASTPLAGGPVVALVGDEYLTAVVALGSDGVARAVRLADGSVLGEKPVLAPAPGAGSSFLGTAAGARGLALVSPVDGRVSLVPVAWNVTFEGDVRSVTPEIGEGIAIALATSGASVEQVTAQMSDDRQTATVAARLSDGSLSLVHRAASENSMTGEVTAAVATHVVPVPAKVASLALDNEASTLYAGTEDGQILSWTLAGEAPAPSVTVSSSDSPVTALCLLLGDQALVAGQADGSLSVWFRLRRPDGAYGLSRVRDFPALPGAVARLVPSTRGKAFFAETAAGEAGLYYSTSHRTLWRGRSPLAGTTAITYGPKANGVFFAGSGRVAVLDVDCPHPEVSLRALFGKVWYESYPKAEYVWQSTGGTEDFEPKLGLTPLLFGTLKGTIYSLILAIPLGVLSAMYASQFMHPSLRRFVKPTVEIMAALPSVVLGFLAGLWIAPRVERIVPGLLLAGIVLPLYTLVAGFLWNRLPRALRGRFPTGTEALLVVFVIAGGLWTCVAVNPRIEAWAFGGDFPSWLLGVTGLRYDQRNALVVGLAMGFAVVPIIFAIAEDAFTNVPRNLSSGSLALGATRWQTVTRIVLPSASPGIFAAIMVGFGRAVGETMIVLMATGNTPIMDWSPFNGFRTLSANVAVEISEAPVGGTLYRILFLAALLPFAVTFLVNTAAEIVRQRLRRRYSQL
jgi:phosphate transport system permease protein